MAQEPRDSGPREKGADDTPYAIGAEVFVPVDEVGEKAGSGVHLKTFLAIFAVNVIYFAQLINIVGTGAYGQTLAAHFGRPGEATWFLGSTNILSIVLGLMISQAADYWGRKIFLVTMSFLAAAGSLVVALSKSYSAVIAGFIIMGIGYGNQPLLHAVTSEVIPRRWRGWGQASNMLSNCLGAAVALVGGGALNRDRDPASTSFRYFYFMIMGWFLLGGIICFFVYNPPKTEWQSLPLREKLAKLDWIGYVFISSGLTLFCMGLSWSQNPYPWSDAHVSAPFGISIAVLIGFILYEMYVKKDGLFHHDLFRFRENRNFVICLFCVFTEGAAFFAANLYFAYQVSTLYEHDSLIVGIRFTIMFLIAGGTAGLVGLYCAVSGRARWMTFAAFVLFIVFFVCMATTTRHSDKQVWGYPVLLGVAMGPVITILVTLAQLSAPPKLIALASGLMLGFRATGSTVGLAIYHAIFTSAINDIESNVANAIISHGLSPEYVDPFIAALNDQNYTALHNIPGSTSKVIERGEIAFLDTYVEAFRNVWIAGACFVAVAAIASIGLVDYQDSFNMHIDAPLEVKQNSD